MFNFFNIQEIDGASLNEMLARDDGDVKIIDVRMPAELRQGAIPGAENIPLNLLPGRIEELPEDRPVVFYCRTGARSAQACAYVASRGREDVYNLRGGIVAWAGEGRAVA